MRAEKKTAWLIILFHGVRVMANWGDKRGLGCPRMSQKLAVQSTRAQRASAKSLFETLSNNGEITGERAKGEEEKEKEKDKMNQHAIRGWSSAMLGEGT